MIYRDIYIYVIECMYIYIYNNATPPVSVSCSSDMARSGPLTHTAAAQQRQKFARLQQVRMRLRRLIDCNIQYII